MLRATILLFFVWCSTTLGQECNQYFAPWDFVTMIDASEEARVEFSVDCFDIPSESWGGDSQWANQELYTAEDLVLSEMGWWEVGRLGWFPGFGSGRVLDHDGMPLRIESTLTQLSNGRVVSIATIPHLVGLPAEPGEVTSGPIQAGEELFMLWRLDVDPAIGMGSDYLALWSASGRLSRELSFNVVPEPSSVSTLLLILPFLMTTRCRRRL